jgi:hypothetical protein
VDFLVVEEWACDIEIVVFVGLLELLVFGLWVVVLVIGWDGCGDCGHRQAFRKWKMKVLAKYQYAAGSCRLRKVRVLSVIRN